MVGGPWITDANFKSSIYLKNVVETSRVTVTPVLYLSNGAKYVLPDVTLEPAGTAIVDINAGLQAQGIASYATLSGYVELRYNWPWDPICALIRDVDVVHSLIFTYGIQAPPSALPQNLSAAPTSHVIEGVRWKQEANVTGFVSLANTSSEMQSATVQVSDNHAAVLGTYRVTISPHGMKTLNLRELQSPPTSEGGIRINYVGPQDALLINGGLEDQHVGYSANLRFASDVQRPLPDFAQATTATSFAALGLMVGAADPMMLFPAGTTFTPYSVLRNVSGAPVSVTPMLWWMQNGAANSASTPQVTLLPHQSRSLDVMGLISAAGLKNFNGSVNLVFDVQGTASGLLLAAGSVDQTNTYVFEVSARGVVESAGKSISYWSTANGDDTMVTLWNPADEAQDFVFRLIFSGGHYGLPIHLEARATRTFNISEIIQNQVPDSEGNIVPATVHVGSAKILGAHADNESILVATETGVYNVRKATCGNVCMSCDGATSYSMLDSPFAMAVGGQKQETLQAQWNTGARYDDTGASTWSSNNTAVATVQTGLGHGVSAGSVNFVANYPTGPIYTPYQCYGAGMSCPIAQGGGGSGSGSVAQLSCTSSVARGSATTCTVTPSSATVSGWQFKDGSGNTVTRTASPGSLTWPGVMVTGGTVSVTATVSGASTPLSTSIAVTNRTNFAFTAVNPTPLTGNSITCYASGTTVLTTPPNGGSLGASCPDLTFSFVAAAPISDNGPNNGYQYASSVSSTNESGQPTQFQYIIVSDLLSATTFYNKQCGTYSSSNSSGFIAGSQLKQNVLDHEAGSVLSHWTEYVNAQNNSSNNIGTVLEANIGTPGTSQSAYALALTNAGTNATNSILTAVAAEPCNDLPNDDSSQSCKYCGSINYSPYTSCGNSQPVPYCH
jgi:hypothetical protein